MAESRLGEALSCPQGLGLNGPIGPFKPSMLIFQFELNVPIAIAAVVKSCINDVVLLSDSLPKVEGDYCSESVRN